MSVREVKVWMVECEAWHKDGDSESQRCRKTSGPHFVEYRHEVPIPQGWGFRTLHDCGMTGYTRRDLFCGECIKRYGVKVDA